MQSEFNEEVKTQDEEKPAEEGFVYKAVMKGEGNKRTFSIISLVLSVLSVLLFIFPWVAIVFGIAGVVFSLLSRYNLGYFDGFSLAGLIVGIFGIVFGIAGIAFGSMIASVFF